MRDWYFIRGKRVSMDVHQPGQYCQRCDLDLALFGSTIWNHQTMEHLSVPDIVFKHRMWKDEVVHV